MSQLTYNNPVPNSTTTEASPGYKNNFYIATVGTDYWYSTGKNLLIHSLNGNTQIIPHSNLITSEYIWLFGKCDDKVLGIIDGGIETKLIVFDAPSSTRIFSLNSLKVHAAIVEGEVVIISCTNPSLNNNIFWLRFNCSDLNATTTGYGYGYGYGGSRGFIPADYLINFPNKNGKIVAVGALGSEYYGILVNSSGLIELVALLGTNSSVVTTLPEAPVNTPSPMAATNQKKLYFFGSTKVFSYNAFSNAVGSATSEGFPVATPFRNYTSLSINKDEQAVIGFDRQDFNGSSSERLSIVQAI